MSAKPPTIDVHVTLAVTEHGIVCTACKGQPVVCHACYGHVTGRRIVAPDLANRMARIRHKLPVPDWSQYSPEWVDYGPF